VSTRETYRNALGHALTVAGNERELAARLGVGVPQLENWLSGVEEIPDQVFLAIVDVVSPGSPPS
jgi:DNA-binding transcriptional regulator YdaS (Cro superfamily)